MSAFDTKHAYLKRPEVVRQSAVAKRPGYPMRMQQIPFLYATGALGQ